MSAAFDVERGARVAVEDVTGRGDGGEREDEGVARCVGLV